MTSAATLRPLDPVGDRAALEGLWSAALDPPWPLLPGGLDATRSGLVAEGGGRVKGAVGTDPAGSITLLLVDPAHQRQGVGTLLLEEALRRFGALGRGTVSLGSGGEDYIWPGVPDNLPDAVRFFTARGWRFAPAGMHERAARAGTTIELAGGEDQASVLAFEAETFPSWLRWFQREDSSVLVARDSERRVVGSLLFRGPGPVSVFAPLLGPMAGTIGCVGVAGHAQDRGIGSAMVARASELLRDAGTRMCHISSVSRQAFYVRVGYTPWRRYLMSQRHLWTR
jgi:ribosomal protein S18 acetylase RimI-like enzyme